MGLMLLLTFGCAGDGGPRDDGDAAREVELERARELARRFLIVDTHIDVPWRLEQRPADVSRRTADGDFDHPRALEGGLDAAFMSIFVPADFQETGGAREKADELIDMVERLAADSPDKFVIARSVADAISGQCVMSSLR